MNTEGRELSGLKISKSKIENEYLFIDSPKSKVSLAVAQNVSEKHKVTDDQGREKYIVNFKAIADDQIGEVLDKFANSDEIPVEELNGLTLTGSIWVNDGQAPQLPMRGEKVDCIIDYVKDRQGDQVLRVTNLALKAPEQASKVSFEQLFQKYGVVSDEETVQQTN